MSGSPLVVGIVGRTVAVPNRAWPEPLRTVEAVTFNNDLAHHRARPIYDGALLDDLAHDPTQRSDGTLDHHLAYDFARPDDDASLDDRAAGHDGPGLIILAIISIVRRL